MSCQKIPKNKDDFENFQKWQLNFRPWEIGKSHGKGHGKSWNLENSKEYEPLFIHNNKIAKCITCIVAKFPKKYKEVVKSTIGHG